MNPLPGHVPERGRGALNKTSDFVGGSAEITSLTPDGLNRESAIVGGAACGPSAGYDCNGNVLTDRAGARRFAGARPGPALTGPGNGENRLISITASGLNESLSYDPTGRLSRTVANGAPTNFYWDGDDLVVEYDDSGNVLRRFIHGPGVNNPLEWFEGGYVDAAHQRNLITDHQGTIIGWSDQNGALSQSYTYDAYGSPASWNLPRYAYTGQIALPEAQLYYYHARFYDPVAERFLQTDPVGYKADINLYAYVADDPVNRGDPTGEDPDVTYKIQYEKDVTGSHLGGQVLTQTLITVTSSQGGSGYSNLSPSRSLAQQKADFSNPRINGIPDAKRQETIATLGVPAVGMAIGASIIAVPELGVAAMRELGPSGNIFGRARLGGSSLFKINANDYLRVGWGWTGSAKSGRPVFRISGDILDKITGTERSHIDLFYGKSPSP